MGYDALKPAQKAKYDQVTDMLPADLVPGYVVASSGNVDPESAFLKGMARFSRDMERNAYSYFNVAATGKGPLKKRRRRPVKIISPVGFPPDISITYTYPPMFAFRTPMSVREVKHFVLHSFGHGWHATYKDKRWIGWLNDKAAKKGAVPIQFENKTVYIPKGSDPESMAHFSRFSAGLRACLGTAAKATAHFFIDRDGNLVVVGDCNDILYTSQGVSRTSCGVEIEEAFYVLQDTKGKGNKAKWRPGGSPPGTGGNIKYFAYSPKQLMTLSILVKKLETAYPLLKERATLFDRQTLRPTGPPGYTMHDFIRGSHHIDVSPHFLTRDFWEVFFELVDSHTHINASNVFKPRQKWRDSGVSEQVPPLADVTVTAMTDRLLQLSKTRGLAVQRSFKSVQQPREEINVQAGNNAITESDKITRQTADAVQLMQQTQNLEIPTPAKEQEETVYGLEVGSDDWL